MENVENVLWQKGDVVELPMGSTAFRTTIGKVYEHLQASRYVCVQEAAPQQRGILVKVLHRCVADKISLIGGEPFVLDEKFDSFSEPHYCSFRFPTVRELQHVLNIVQADASLRRQLGQADMDLSPDATYWVRDCGPWQRILRRPQYFDPLAQRTSTVQGIRDAVHRRLTLLYFEADGQTLTTE